MALPIEKIAHASVVMENGWIIMGKSHSDCFDRGRSIGTKPQKRADAQGFVTNLGRVVTRPEAYKIALASGQLNGNENRSGILISEMLWCDRDGGSLAYDYVNGYHKDIIECI